MRNSQNTCRSLYFSVFHILIVYITLAHGSNPFSFNQIHSRSFKSIISRSTSCSGIDTLQQCSVSDTAGFCCPANTNCLALNNTGTESVLCCPFGETCELIRAISCDNSLQNASLHPESTVHTANLSVPMQTCSKGCCPLGYDCRSDGNCIMKAMTKLPSMDRMYKTTEASTFNKETMKKMTTPFSGASFLAGIVTGSALFGIVSSLFYWFFRHYRRGVSRRSRFDEKDFCEVKDASSPPSLNINVHDDDYDDNKQFSSNRLTTKIDDLENPKLQLDPIITRTLSARTGYWTNPRNSKAMSDSASKRSSGGNLATYRKNYNRQTQLLSPPPTLPFPTDTRKLPLMIKTSAETATAVQPTSFMDMTPVATPSRFSLGRMRALLFINKENAAKRNQSIEGGSLDQRESCVIPHQFQYNQATNTSTLSHHQSAFSLSQIERNTGSGIIKFNPNTLSFANIKDSPSAPGPLLLKSTSDEKYSEERPKVKPRQVSTQTVEIMMQTTTGSLNSAVNPTASNVTTNQANLGESNKNNGNSSTKSMVKESNKKSTSTSSALTSRLSEMNYSQKISRLSQVSKQGTKYSLRRVSNKSRYPGLSRSGKPNGMLTRLSQVLMEAGETPSTVNGEDIRNREDKVDQESSSSSSLSSLPVNEDNTSNAPVIVKSKPGENLQNERQSMKRSNNVQLGQVISGNPEVKSSDKAVVAKRVDTVTSRPEETDRRITQFPTFRNLSGFAELQG